MCEGGKKEHRFSYGAVCYIPIIYFTKLKLHVVIISQHIQILNLYTVHLKCNTHKTPSENKDNLGI